MSALKIKDAQGNWIEVPMIKGDKGDKGEQGDTYELTEQDKQDIADLVDVPEPLKYVKDDPSNNGGVIEGLVELPTDVTLNPAAKTNIASGENAHAEGGYLAYITVNGNRIYNSFETLASGKCSHAEGGDTSATTDCAHAEGYGTVASADCSHAEGQFATASGSVAHAEGNRTTASGMNTHAEGASTTASGNESHAEGYSTIASGYASHAEGYYTKASSQYQHVQGKYNIEDNNNTYAHIVGGGTNIGTRANIHTLDWNGNGVYAGKLTVGTAPTNDMDVATKKYVDDVKGASIHICSSAEYDSTTRVPTITNPDEKTFYLVPSEDGTSPDLFVEWAYVNNNWEMFGSASIDLSNYVTNTDYATGNNGGVVRVNGYGLKINASNGIIQTSGATSGIIKSATGSDAEYRPVTPLRQHESTFYGLAKASGDSTQSASSNAVGTYTDEAKASIKNMLGVQDGMVVNATLMSDPWYSVDKTYAEIGLAVADGINVVILSDGKVFPYAGMMYFQSVSVITFGSFFAYDGKLVSNGFIVIMDDNDATIAQKIQSETTIPTLNDVQINGTSVVTDGVAEIPIATQQTLGVVSYQPAYGITLNTGNQLRIDPANDTQIKTGESNYKPIVVSKQHESAFYGLAKVAGHDEKDSTLALGQYTPEAKGAIQSMLGIDSLIAPTETNPFTDAHAIGDLFIINGALYKAKTAIAVGDVLDDGVNVESVDSSDVYVKNTDIATQNKAGIVKVASGYGIKLYDDKLRINEATDGLIKAGTDPDYPIVSKNAHTATFYGLAKASGDTTQSQSDNAIGTYTDEAKASIKSMLGVQDNMVVAVTGTGQMRSINKSLVEIVSALQNGINVVVTDGNAIYPYVGKTEINGVEHQAFGTSVMFNNVCALDGYLLGTNETEGYAILVNQRATIPTVNVDDVQINGTSVLNDGVANIPIASGNTFGAITVGNGLVMYSSGKLTLNTPTLANIKTGTEAWKAITPSQQHASVFYGLAKASGDTTQSQSDNAVGTYTDDAKSSIQTMLGLGDVVRNTDYCTDNTTGVARTNSSFGVTATSTGNLRISAAASNQIKAGVDGYKPITPLRQNEAVFYGLAKVSGDTTQSASSNAVGTYTDEAKTAIKQMLGVVDSYDSLVVNVTGTDPVITAQPSYRYNCGEVTTLTITPPSSGTIDFIFTSGTTPTVLDLPNTVKMPSWWIGVEANTTYEMCITDGVYCGVMSWDA